MEKVVRERCTGRFVAVLCPDPNCDGILIPDMYWGNPIWACNGLTHDTDEGELRPCERTFDRPR
jgi:hypothetical protein